MSRLMPEDKIVKYTLSISEGVFENDECAFESPTPFAPIHVGDYISPRSDIPAIEKRPYRVVAVQHTINEYDGEIVHTVHVCVRRWDDSSCYSQRFDGV